MFMHICFGWMAIQWYGPLNKHEVIKKYRDFEISQGLLYFKWKLWYWKKWSYTDPRGLFWLLGWTEEMVVVLLKLFAWGTPMPFNIGLVFKLNLDYKLLCLDPKGCFATDFTNEKCKLIWRFSFTWCIWRIMCELSLFYYWYRPLTVPIIFFLHESIPCLPSLNAS